MATAPMPVTTAATDVETILKQGEPTRPRRPTVRTAGVALLSMAVGVGGTLLIQRSRAGAGAARPAADPMSMSGMTGVVGTSESGAAPPRPAGAGSKAVFISTARQQLIGVRTAKVARHKVGGELRTVGALTYDETRVTEIHTRIAGWVDRVFVDFVGKPIRRGAPLFALYSPDLVTAQSEYLVAVDMQGDLATKTIADGLMSASSQRLRRMGVTEGEIAQLARTRKVTETITLYSPFDGVVLERDAFAGQYVTPDTKTFKVGDLSTIWAVGQAFEYQGAQLRIGQPVDVEFPNDANASTIRTSISFIYPGVDPQTRRVRFRAALRNDKLTLKPDTFVTMSVVEDTNPALTVPREAVIDTGARQYVLLALPDGYFEPHDVRIGAAIGDEYPVENGLVEGDSVVVSAQFLIDSETNLMEAMQNMTMSMPGMEMGAPPNAGGPASAAPKASAKEMMPTMDMLGMPPPASPLPAASPSGGLAPR